MYPNQQMIFTTNLLALTPTMVNAYDYTHESTSETETIPQLYPKWHRITERLQNIAVGDYLACGTTKFDQIYCAKAKTVENDGETQDLDEWKLKQGKLEKLALDGSSAVGLDNDGLIYYSDSMDKSDPSWVQVGEQATSIDISNGHIIAISTDKQLLLGSTGTSTSWSIIGAGHYYDAAVYGNQICAISTTGKALMCTSDISVKPVTWTEMKSAPTFMTIQMSRNRICGMGTNHHLYCSDSTGEVWRIVHLATGSFDINESTIYKTGKSGAVYWGAFNN
eukprot:NODE_171_length_14381_cov_0.662512.p5 type:complete len:279 gc:universal NODE_171_length_14381_cov_0.662512:13535-14371(+)